MWRGTTLCTSTRTLMTSIFPQRTSWLYEINPSTNHIEWDILVRSYKQCIGNPKNWHERWLILQIQIDSNGYNFHFSVNYIANVVALCTWKEWSKCGFPKWTMVVHSISTTYAKSGCTGGNIMDRLLDNNDLVMLENFARIGEHERVTEGLG